MQQFSTGTTAREQQRQQVIEAVCKAGHAQVVFAVCAARFTAIGIARLCLSCSLRYSCMRACGACLSPGLRALHLAPPCGQSHVCFAVRTLHLRLPSPPALLIFLYFHLHTPAHNSPCMLCPLLRCSMQPAPLVGLPPCVSYLYCACVSFALCSVARKLHLLLASHPALRLYRGEMGPPAIVKQEEAAVGSALKHAFRQVSRTYRAGRVCCRSSMAAARCAQCNWHVSGSGTVPFTV